MKNTKRLIPIILLSVLLCSFVFSSVAFASTGARTDPFSGYIKRSLSLQEYSFTPARQIQLQLLSLIHGNEANSIVAEENMYNATPDSDEEWILMKYHLKYVSGPDEPLYAYEAISSMDSFYTSGSTAINPIDTATFSRGRSGLGEYEVNMYPGGESDVWYGILVKKTVGYPLYRVGTGYNEASYSTIYTWFATDPNYKETLSYTVTFNSQGGSTVPKQTVQNSGLVTKPADPTRSGYLFSGWYKQAACTAAWNFATDKVTANTILYAKWTPFTAPASPKAIAMSYNSVKVTWSAVSGASGYEVWRSTGSGYTLAATASGTSATNTGLATGTTYYYKVRAYRTVNSVKVYGAYSSVVSAKPTLAATTGLKATAATYNSVKLTWTATAGAGGYEVWRSTSSASGYALAATVAGASATSSGLATGKTYYYKVRAYRTVNSVKVYGAYSSVVSAKPTLAATTGLKATAATYNSVKLTWTATAGAGGYEVWRSTSSASGYALAATVAGASATNSGLATGTTYFYKVRAYRMVNGTKVYGAYSAVVPAKPSLTSPTGVKAARVSATSIKVSWAAVAGAMKYEVWRATSSGGTYYKLPDTTTPSYTNTGLTTGKMYYYKVRAYRTMNGVKVYGKYSVVVYAKP